HHPNILQCYGYYFYETSYNSYKIGMITELFNRDENLEIIYRSREKKHVYWSEDSLLKIAYNLIDTFAYLEHIGICHRDIKPTNLFLLENYQIKVIDFGESIVNYDDDEEEDNQVATVRGTPQYLSPKLWEAHVIKKAKEVEHNMFKSDVFSAGLVLFQLAAMKDVGGFNQKTEHNNGEELIRKGLKELSKKYSNNLIEIIRKMLIFEEEKRPNFEQMGMFIAGEDYVPRVDKNIIEQKGSNFNIGLGGSKYTLRLSIRKFKTEETDIHFRGNLPDIEDSKFDDRLKMEMDEPIRVSSILLDGYYMFNGKHFSNTAGYDQSTIQMRSAGSFIVGASWLNASIDYSANMNTFFVIMMNNCGRIRINQVNIGAGYAYNWVPCKGLLVNAMFMPTITPYSQLKVWNYDFDENDNYEYKSSDVNYSYSRIKVNLCSWVTFVYNYKDWFATAKGQWNQFSYKRNDSNGRLSDWYLNVGIGWRF
ncbi:MAG: DUF4421 family protein, partial [Prevotella sp.]|nr:DUF4421 family protein [Prevotella sp.]